MLVGKGPEQSGKSTTVVVKSEFVTTSGGSRSARSTFEAGAQGTMDLVMVDTVIYLKNSSPKPGQKAWTRLDPAGKDPMSAMLGGLFAAFGDPGAMVTSGWSTATLTKVGASAGVTEYDVVGMTGTENSRVKVWLDAQDRPAKFTLVDTSPTSRLASAELTFSDWGAPITISAPPADQVEVLALPTS